MVALAIAPVASSSAPNPGVSNYDVRFMTGMKDHHAMAVEMARTCPHNATHEELPRLCQSIGASRSRQIGRMRTWLMDWYGASHEPQSRATS